MRILLADDHALFRDGVASLLEAWGHEVVGQAADGAEPSSGVRARARPRPHGRPDAGQSGIDGHPPDRRRASPASPIVMLTASEDEDDLFAAIKAGARGYLLKNLEAAELRGMLEAVERGEAAITPATAARIILADAVAPGAEPVGAAPDTPDGSRARRPAARDRRSPEQGDRRGRSGSPRTR